MPRVATCSSLSCVRPHEPQIPSRVTRIVPMKGSIYKSTSGAGRTTWRYQIDAGRDENGRRIRVGQSGFRLEREATDAMHDRMRNLKHGPVNTVATLSEYLNQ